MSTHAIKTEMFIRVMFLRGLSEVRQVNLPEEGGVRDREEVRTDFE